MHTAMHMFDSMLLFAHTENTWVPGACCSIHCNLFDVQALGHRLAGCAGMAGDVVGPDVACAGVLLVMQ